MYDVIIIGAGIGGLVCGCYLAKGGLKVLIAEQHHKPGGYCTSFSRQGFSFDAAAHSFGGYREEGLVRQVFSELSVDKKIIIKRYEPSDVIKTPEFTFSYWSDLSKTLDELVNIFPKEERNISTFFKFLLEGNPKELVKIRLMTFQDLLDRFFADYKLKAAIAFPLYGNGGLPPMQLSAFAGIKILSEFILDGGYYPNGGMQRLSDALAAVFREAGGTLMLSREVKQIIVKDGTATGVAMEDGEVHPACMVLSACDARQTFLSLLGRDHLPEVFFKLLMALVPSSSLFVAYLGIDKYTDSMPQPGSNLWYLPQYDLDYAYKMNKTGALLKDRECMVRISPDKKTLLAFLGMPFNDQQYWIEHKEATLTTLVRLISERIIPEIGQRIVYQGAATPYTMYRYTKNFAGAAYGWASTPSQFLIPGFRKPAFVQGLRLVGHWSTVAQGIPGVIYNGFETARAVLRERKKSSGIALGGYA